MIHSQYHLGFRPFAKFALKMDDTHQRKLAEFYIELQKGEKGRLVERPKVTIKNEMQNTQMNHLQHISSRM